MAPNMCVYVGEIRNDSGIFDVVLMRLVLSADGLVVAWHVWRVMLLSTLDPDTIRLGPHSILPVVVHLGLGGHRGGGARAAGNADA